MNPIAESGLLMTGDGHSNDLVYVIHSNMYTVYAGSQSIYSGQLILNKDNERVCGATYLQKDGKTPP